MQLMRDILWRSLAKSLSTLTPLDRLAAAWPVVAGHATAARSAVVHYEGGCVTVAAATEEWRQQLTSSAIRLRGDLQRVSGATVTDILVVLRTGLSQDLPHDAHHDTP